MSREPYNAEKEHAVTGRMYPGVESIESNGFRGIPSVPAIYRPIAPRDNYRMNLAGETPYWIPACGWFFCDVTMFRPRQQMDNFANHQCIDGGPWVPYDELGDVLPGWFGLNYLWEADIAGAMVVPGPPTIDDMDDWESTLQMPSLDDIDFDEIARMNAEYLDSDRVNQLGIQLGFWERLMNLMNVDNAAVALLDEDQADGLHRFLDALSDVYIDYIGRLLKAGCRIDAVYLHDDWGTQNGPFFSLETAREFFVPPMKKVVDFCHANGILFEHHCCGNAGKLIPAMEECGTDFWIPQWTCNDTDSYIEQYKDYHIKFGVYSPKLAPGMTAEEVRESARQWVDKYADTHIMYCHNIDLIGRGDHDENLFPIWEDAVYEYSRKKFQGAA